MGDMEPVLYQSRLEGSGSKDSQAHLLSALAQTRPEDLGLVIWGTVLYSSPLFVLLPQNGPFFSKSPREWGIVPVNIYF